MQAFYGVVSAQNAMQRDKATLLGRTLALQQALERYPLIQGGKLINMSLCRAELITYLINHAEFVSKGPDLCAGALQTVPSEQTARQNWLRLVKFSSRILHN